MSSTPHSPLSVAPAAGAPGPILAYAIGTAIPTRVRFNTAQLTRRWGFWIRMAGLLALNIEFCVYAWWILDGCYDGFDSFLFHVLGVGNFGRWRWYWSGGGPHSFGDVLTDCTEYNWPVLLFGITFFLDGLLLFLLGRGIKNGSRLSAGVAIGALAPAALVLLAGTLAALAGAIVQTLTGGGLVFLLLLLPTAMGMLVLVLMVGAFRQLAWVIRNPDLEQAPLRFWPRRAKNR